MAADRIRFVILLSLCAVHIANAQEAVRSPFQIGDMYFMAGGGSLRNGQGTLQDFMRLSPDSEILNSDLTGFEENAFYSNGSTSLISAGVGFYLPKNLDNPANNIRTVLRFDITYRYIDALYAGSSLTDSTRIDTLTSSQSGDLFFRDSISTTRISSNLWTNAVYAGASLLFYTNPKSRWSFFWGLGFGVGVGFQTRVANTRSLNSSRSQLYQKRDDEDFNLESENFDQRNAIAGELFLPIGVDFKLGKNKNWSKMHIAYNLRPMVSFTKFAELGTLTQPGLTQALILRYSFMQEI